MLAVYPMLQCDHKDALYGIVAALSGKTVDEVKEQPSGEMLSAIRENSTKEQFGFFRLPCGWRATCDAAAAPL